jgi:hypothetical protein
VPEAATHAEEATERRAHHAGWHRAHVLALAVCIAEGRPERIDQGLAVEVAERAVARGVALAQLQVEVLRSDAAAPMLSFFKIVVRSRAHVREGFGRDTRAEAKNIATGAPNTTRGESIG